MKMKRLIVAIRSWDWKETSWQTLAWAVMALAILSTIVSITYQVKYRRLVRMCYDEVSVAKEIEQANKDAVKQIEKGHKITRDEFWKGVRR